MRHPISKVPYKRVNPHSSSEGAREKTIFFDTNAIRFTAAQDEAVCFAFKPMIPRSSENY